ncbi:hypothetical protein TNCV_4413181 [Trichonephila clavipes]|nr:hypothetical protein TNCV_4413181 [Trichonephila clavipes]
MTGQAASSWKKVAESFCTVDLSERSGFYRESIWMIYFPVERADHPGERKPSPNESTAPYLSGSARFLMSDGERKRLQMTEGAPRIFFDDKLIETNTLELLRLFGVVCCRERQTTLVLV